MLDYTDQRDIPQEKRYAVLIHPDGSRLAVMGKGKGNKITLEQAQDLIGGYVERVDGVPGGIILVDEEGLLKGLPLQTVPFPTRAGQQFAGRVLYIPRGMGW